MPRLRRDEQVERNREKLLDSARHVFLARGYLGATLEDIAEHAGFSKGVVYSQFDSKADLMFGLLDRRIAERTAQNVAVTRNKVGADGIVALLRNAERDLAAEPGWARLLVEFRIFAARDRELNRRYAAAHARTIESVSELIATMFERAAHKPAISPRAIADLVLAFGTGVALEQAVVPDARHFRTLEALCLRALGSEAP
jgi:AcrR family transcriptional regulator